MFTTQKEVKEFIKTTSAQIKKVTLDNPQNFFQIDTAKTEVNNGIRAVRCEFCRKVCSTPCETETNAKKCFRYKN